MVAGCLWGARPSAPSPPPFQVANCVYGSTAGRGLSAPVPGRGALRVRAWGRERRAAGRGRAEGVSAECGHPRISGRS
ncbi:hypothetical protein NDU88_000815 [Pleurodeles waltl]|uniref:Uncharacterized protein n=1 Tax=Pleurodeles waltl TaxID=8319 RepID=A0AAV7P232_PLEWA|nr:hypothetical protein NDU88_000815 [Pleurodeles waltl]